MVFRQFIQKRSLSSTLNDFLLKSTNKDSTVYKGTLFEYQTLASLERLKGMSLTRVGGGGDGGIDLRGRWTSSSFDVNIVVQCKNVKTGCTPEYVRGLMGTIAQFNKQQKKKKDSVIGILATTTTTTTVKKNGYYTPKVIQQVTQSPVPLGLALIQDTTIKSLLFNKRALSILKDLDISTRFDTEGNEHVFIDIKNNSSSNDDDGSGGDDDDDDKINSNSNK